MPLLQDSKKTLIERYRVHPKDSGSTEVQIALLSNRINYLTDHYRKNRKDHSSQRGLLVLVGRRKRLLEYMKRRNVDGYHQLIEKLGIRKYHGCDLPIGITGFYGSSHSEEFLPPGTEPVFPLRSATHL